MARCILHAKRIWPAEATAAADNSFYRPNSNIGLLFWWYFKRETCQQKENLRCSLFCIFYLKYFLFQIIFEMLFNNLERQLFASLHLLLTADKFQRFSAANSEILFTCTESFKSKSTFGWWQHTVLMHSSPSGVDVHPQIVVQAQQRQQEHHDAAKFSHLPRCPVTFTGSSCDTGVKRAHLSLDLLHFQNYFLNAASMPPLRRSCQYLEGKAVIVFLFFSVQRSEGSPLSGCITIIT